MPLTVRECADRASITVPSRAGPDPALQRLEADRAARRVIAAVLVEFAGGDVEAKQHILAGAVTRLADGLEDHLDGFLVGAQVRREAALVAHRGGQAPTLQHALQRVEDLGAAAQRLGEAGDADRQHHELLHVDIVVGMRPAIDDVHHRHRQQRRAVAGHQLPQPLPAAGRQRMRIRQRDPEQRVGAQACLVLGAVQRDQAVVQALLVGRIQADHRLGDGAVDVGHRLAHALAEVTRLVAIAQLDRLARTSGSAARHGRAPAVTAGQGDFGFERRVAARIQDFAGVDVGDGRHFGGQKEKGKGKREEQQGFRGGQE